MTHEADADEFGTRTGGALVALGAGSPPAAPPPRPLASFVTQLIACERRLGAYRDRRRGSPEEAGGRYREREVAAPLPRRGRIDRSL
jgi:hypothetical protein